MEKVVFKAHFQFFLFHFQKESVSFTFYFINLIEHQCITNELKQSKLFLDV